jgi:four helix bundle protein
MQNFNSKFKIDITKRCYLFSLQIITLTGLLPNKRSVWVITNQLIRSATSIGANLIEGKAASSRLEYKKFYEIALRSANETKYWLSLLKDSQLIQADKINTLLHENIEIANMLAAGVLKLKRRQF